MSHEKLAAAIRMTIADIDEEFGAAEPLFKLGLSRDFDFIETAAAASILQSFYPGIENLVLFIGKALDGSIPQSQSWHRDLLDSAAQGYSTRAAIFAPATRDRLATYLDFRHVVRHGYARRLRPDRTRALLIEAPKVWAVVREELEGFISSLQAV